MPSDAVGFNFWTENIAGECSDWEAVVHKLWEKYLVGVLGWPESKALSRIEKEISARPHAQLLDALESAGWGFEHKVVLDIGCGTGPLISQLVKRSAYVVGIEPSHSFRQAAALRLRAIDLDHHAQVIAADGARVPIKSSVVDYVFCIQILEHVPKPDQVVKEIARVLKPGGRAYITFENYLSFFEPHYRVRWLPLLPKPLGALYIRLIGREPSFLHMHIRYTVGVSVAIACCRAGLIAHSWENILQKLMHPALVRRPMFRIGAKVVHLLVPTRFLRTFALVYAEARRAFTVECSKEQA